MKIKLECRKNGTVLYDGLHEVGNAEDFGKAFADAWQHLHRAQLSHESSVGALMEHINNSVLDRLDGASIAITKI